VLRRRIGLLLLAALLGAGLFIQSHQWHANAATRPVATRLADRSKRNTKRLVSFAGARSSDRRAPGPVIDPYVRPEFAAEMRTLRPVILAAARRHNRPELSRMSDDDFAVVIALIMYNEHFGWFEEKVAPVQALTPFYENLQRETNAVGISNLSVWPANIRPSVAIEILRRQMPLPKSTSLMTVPVTVAGSQININSFTSANALYAAVTQEITEPDLAVEYLAANLERGLYRAQLEHVPVTWHTLAAWHNQGIVSPQDIRDNATARDYLRRSSAYLGRARRLIETSPYPSRLARRIGE
jgi:hypothetical protein